MKHKVFIASSKEATKIVEAIVVNLNEHFDVRPWQHSFKLSGGILSNLMRISSESDFGIFVFSPDDIVKLRQKSYQAVRDNVVFELGLFIGKMGRERNFFIIPSSYPNFRLPSDLQGIIHANYDTTASDLRTALIPACYQIRDQIKDQVNNRMFSGNCYHISNKASGKCLDVSAWGLSAGTRIIQWTYHGGDNQIWRLQRLDDGSFSVVSKHSKKCLQVKDKSPADGAQITQGAYEDEPHQQWQFTKLPEGSYRISAKHSEQCLTVDLGSFDNAAPIVQSSWHDNDTFKWWLEISTTLD